MHIHPKAPDHPAPYLLIRIAESLIHRGSIDAAPRLLKIPVRSYASLRQAAKTASPVLFSSVYHIDGQSFFLRSPAAYADPCQLRQDFDGPGFVLVDASGRPVPPSLVIAEREKAACERRLKLEKERERTHRKAPAKFCARARRGSPFKNPHTFQEIRFLHDDNRHGVRVKTRAARRNLVDAYDDPSRGKQPNRSWKKYRRHQWK